jgi:hypothetical protein
MADKTVFRANFFDASNPAKSIRVPKDQKVEFTVDNMTYTGKIGSNPDGPQEVILEDAECQKLHNQIGNDGFCADILPIRFKIDCAQYVTPKVSFHLKQDSCDCCFPHVPVNQESTACSIHFAGKHQDSAGKYATPMEKEVTWKVKEIQTSAKGKSTQESAPFNATVRSVNGVAEVFGLPFERLYQFEVQSPEGWICTEPVLYRYICCNSKLKIVSHFDSCASKPIRTVVFVQNECQGMRWHPEKSGQVSLGNRLLDVDQQGFLKVPDDFKEGVFPLSFPAKAFSPASIELRSGGPPVITVTVSDDPAIKPPRTVRCKLVTEDGETPFVHRKIYCKLPNGQETELTSDHEGYFEAAENSEVYCKEDDQGFATPVQKME